MSDDSRPHSELRAWIEKNDPTSIGMYLVEFDRLVEKANLLIDLRRQIDEKLLNQVGELSFPECVVVDENGAYWREFGDHYSMCPVSDDNEPVHPVAVYVPEWRLDAEKDERRSLEEQYEGEKARVKWLQSVVDEGETTERKLKEQKEALERAYRQACMNLATIQPDLTREGDWTLGEFADLYYDALLDGWGGILGYDPGRKPGASNPAKEPN